VYFTDSFFISLKVWKASKGGMNYAIKIMLETDRTCEIEAEIARGVRFVTKFLVAYYNTFRLAFFLSNLPVILFVYFFFFQKTKGEIIHCDGTLRTRRLEQLY
jgi:hypothetical protein